MPILADKRLVGVLSLENVRDLLMVRFGSGATDSKGLVSGFRRALTGLGAGGSRHGRPEDSRADENDEVSALEEGRQPARAI